MEFQPCSTQKQNVDRITIENSLTGHGLTLISQSSLLSRDYESVQVQPKFDAAFEGKINNRSWFQYDADWKKETSDGMMNIKSDPFLYNPNQNFGESCFGPYNEQGLKTEYLKWNSENVQNKPIYQPSWNGNVQKDRNSSNEFSYSSGYSNLAMPFASDSFCHLPRDMPLDGNNNNDGFVMKSSLNTLCESPKSLNPPRYNSTTKPPLYKKRDQVKKACSND